MNHPLNEVRPFRALHYNPAVVGEVGPCLSQPYDVVSPAEQEAYYRRHRWNVIRLILNRIEPGDSETNNRYTRSRDTLADWKEKGVLTRAAQPGFFAYEQTFSVGSEERTLIGFIGLVRLAEYAEGRILPHEKVLKKPVEDRV